MQINSVNLTNNFCGNQLNYNNDLTVIENKNYAVQKHSKTDFLTVIGIAKLRPSFVFEKPKATDHAVAQGTQFYSLTFFYVKSFATIILS